MARIIRHVENREYDASSEARRRHYDQYPECPEQFSEWHRLRGMNLEDHGLGRRPPRCGASRHALCRDRLKDRTPAATVVNIVPHLRDFHRKGATRADMWREAQRMRNIVQDPTSTHNADVRQRHWAAAHANHARLKAEAERPNWGVEEQTEGSGMEVEISIEGKDVTEERDMLMDDDLWGHAGRDS